MNLARKFLPRLAWILIATAVVLWFLSGWAVGAEQNSRTFRVMTYNIHHGEGTDGKVDLERIATLIRHEGADIVALQEVDKGVERTARRDMPHELAALTGMSCVFSNNYSFQGGEYGNAVLTRFPVKSATNSHLKMLEPAEQRGVLQVVVEVSGRDLVVMNTHLDHRPADKERLLSASQILSLARQYAPTPVVLCGDFNDVPASGTYRKLSDSFRDSWSEAGAGNGFTIPSQQPRKRIDYIWVSTGSSLEPVKSWTVSSAASDHLPVVAEFRLSPPR